MFLQVISFYLQKAMKSLFKEEIFLLKQFVNMQNRRM